MLKGRLRVCVNQAPLPVLVALQEQPSLDAGSEAYHNLAAVWWGAFAPNRFVSSWPGGPCRTQPRPLVSLATSPPH